MSKPRAAKDMGACTFRHVLITRHLPVSLVRERLGADVSNSRSSGGAALPPALCMSGRPVEVAGADSEDAAAAAEPVSVPELGALYRVEGPRLLRFFRRRTASAEDAQDLMQESFSRLLGIGASGLTRPEAYLRRIGQNLLRDRAKFAARRSEALHVPADDAVLAGTDQCRLLETRDLLDRLEVAMLELPQQTREIFMAHRLDGMTYAEIAERTGLTIKQVEKRIQRAVAEVLWAMDPD